MPCESPEFHRENKAEFRALLPEEREACLALWCAVWPGENSDRYFRRYFYGDVDWLPYYTQVGIVDGRLVSAAHICRRTVACGDFRLTMGGIANVATLPAYRGQGYNTECLKRAIAVMEADAMDFSLLFTGINGYYARLGYADWPRERLRGRIRPDFSPTNSAYTIRPAVHADVPALREIYAAFNARRPIAVQRSEAYWRDWMEFSPDRMSEPTLLALDERGAALGAVRYRSNFYPGHQQSEDYAVVTEIAWYPTRDSAALAGALLEAAAERAIASGKQELHLNVPQEPEILHALEHILEDRQANTTASGMVRLLHRDNLLRSFLLEWNDRWIAAGRPTGALVFDTPYGASQIAANGSFLSVQTVENDGTALSQSVLFGLLFGTLPVEAVTENAALHPLLRALFPPQAGIYWGADGF